jgi:hypothetical protein
MSQLALSVAVFLNTQDLGASDPGLAYWLRASEAACGLLVVTLFVTTLTRKIVR